MKNKNKSTLLWVRSVGDTLKKGFIFSLVSLLGRADSGCHSSVGSRTQAPVANQTLDVCRKSALVCRHCSSQLLIWGSLGICSHSFSRLGFRGLRFLGELMGTASTETEITLHGAN